MNLQNSQRSIIYTLLHLSTAAFTGLILPPLIVSSVGKPHYGLWCIAGSLWIVLSTLEFGTRYTLTSLIPKKDTYQTFYLYCDAKKIVAKSSFYALTLGIAFLLLLSNKITSQNNLYLLQILILLALIDTFSDIGSAANEGLLTGKNEFDTIAAAQTIRLFITFILVFVFSSLEYGIITISACYVIPRIAMRIFFKFKTKKYFDISIPNKQSEIRYKDIIYYGKASFLLVIVQRLNTQSDIFLLGFVAGASLVSIYALPLVIFEQIKITLVSLAHISTTKYFENKNDLNKAQLINWSKATVITSWLAISPILVTGRDFLTLWLPNLSSNNYDTMNFILSTLSINFLALGVAAPMYAALLGTNRHYLLMRVFMLDFIANIILSLIMYYKIGVKGVALGTTVPFLICHGVLLPKLTLEIFEIKINDFFKEVLQFDILAFHFIFLTSIALFYSNPSWILLALINFGALIAIIYIKKDKLIAVWNDLVDIK